MRSATPTDDLHDWAIDGPLMLISICASIPSLLLSAWLVLHYAGVHVPNDILWFIFIFLIAIPTAPVAFGLGVLAAWRRPIAVVWLLPASVYWIAWLFEAMAP